MDQRAIQIDHVIAALLDESRRRQHKPGVRTRRKIDRAK
jgi:hypothetical protein